MFAVGYPIAEITSDGGVTITKPEGAAGAVTVDICKAQLLYEIQGQIYLNPDVIADIKDVRLEEVGKNRVALSGIKGIPPPPRLCSNSSKMHRVMGSTRFTQQ